MALTVGSYAGTAGIVSRPDLFERLSDAGRVVHIAAPPGSGKTVLMRSWIQDAGLGEKAAWVSVLPDEVDIQRFWGSVVDALRGTAPGSGVIGPLTPAIDLDGWALVERLLKDLDALRDPVWLLIDDAHELKSSDALRQLELILMRGPANLRFVLATRHDLHLGLHRLRLEGDLTEIRVADFRFDLEEARALFQTADVALSEPMLKLIHERTEGWAAGLRLAALSLRGHPEPDRFAAEFSGTERTVAEYLVAEVLDRQPEPVKRLLLRTSILERVNGSLADLLTGDAQGERILQELEEANAFVVSLDAGRSWFRYHRLFADLLQLELRRTAGGDLPVLHSMAARWFASNDLAVEAIRHAQAAGEWEFAVRLLDGCWPRLELEGLGETIHELLGRFPATLIEANAELVAAVAADHLYRGSLVEAERTLGRAARMMGSVPAEERDRFNATVGVLRLDLAQERGDLAGVIAESQQFLGSSPSLGSTGMDEHLRALALINLGAVELASARLDDSERHINEGVALARRIGAPYLEVMGAARAAHIGYLRSPAIGVERSRQAIELGRHYGWRDELILSPAYTALVLGLVAQGRLEEAETWFAQAERAIRPEVDPRMAALLHYARGLLELALGRKQAALGAFESAERLIIPLDRLASNNLVALRSFIVRSLVRLDEMQRAERVLEQINQATDDANFWRAAGAAQRTAMAELLFARGDPEAAAAAMAPVVDGPVQVLNPTGQLTQAFVLYAIVKDALGDQAGANAALERALDLAEPDGVLLPFLLYPAPHLLDRVAGRRTAHAALVAELRSVLAGASRRQSPEPERLREPLTDRELRVLRYLPTNLSVPEIAREVFLSANTVKTHTRNLYAKLEVHQRREAVERARSLGLLAPSSRRN